MGVFDGAGERLESFVLAAIGAAVVVVRHPSGGGNTGITHDFCHEPAIGTVCVVLEKGLHKCLQGCIL